MVKHSKKSVRFVSIRMEYQIVRAKTINQFQQNLFNEQRKYFNKQCELWLQQTTDNAFICSDINVFIILEKIVTKLQINQILNKIQ